MTPLSTSSVARSAGVHPNTVRLYEKWGFISPVPRTRSGYRCFSQRHLSEMRFARLALPGPYPARKDLLPAAVRAYAREDSSEAKALVNSYAAAMQEERRLAEEALAVLDSWHTSQNPLPSPLRGGRKQMARRSGVSLDTLRSWERSGILVPARTQSGRMAYTTADMDRILVVRLLRRRGFSLIALQRVFSGASGLTLPSEYLTRIYQNHESICESDPWMAHLEAHFQRAGQLMAYLEAETPTL